MYRVPPDTAKKLSAEGYDLWTVGLWEIWLEKMHALDPLLAQIEIAFEGIKLGDGIGLREANELCFYGSETECAIQRDLDEKEDWRRISDEALNENATALTFLDPAGFHFHFPAFLRADLNGKFDSELMNELVRKDLKTRERLALFNQKQLDVVIETLGLLKFYPDYYHQQARFDRAISAMMEKP